MGIGDMSGLTEIQIDRIVGPTHHFGGLGVGNLASSEHAGRVSDPKAAALEGLDKMRLVASLDAVQLILPPQPRPDFAYLASLGFDPVDLTGVLGEAPHLLSAAISSSAMWTANAATVTPACDNDDHQTHATVANLNASLHRVIEAPFTFHDLTNLLPASVSISEALPPAIPLSDEGAANHMRFCGTGDEVPGINLFVYGDGVPAPTLFQPRQTLQASQAIARRHRVIPENTFFLQQHPQAIDTGAFHNDVVAMSHQDCWIHHELAYADCTDFKAIEARFAKTCGTKLRRISVSSAELSLEASVRTYLFNSQILSSPHRGNPPHLICPSQVRDSSAAASLVHKWLASRIFSDVHYVDLSQSMSGGGGPACLRLRVPMTQDAIRGLDPRVRWSETIDRQLRDIIDAKYPDCFQLSDLRHPTMLRDINQATIAIQQILQSIDSAA